MLVAAALKIHGLIVDPYAHDNFLSAPWLQVLTIEVEVLLGLWLLSRLQPQLAWYVTLLFFVALSIFSFILATQGQTSCGCFGSVEVNPWYTFALDVSIILVMVFISLRVPVPLSLEGGRVRGEAAKPGALFGSILQVAFFTTILLGTIALGFTLFTGDPWAALARLRGETLAVTPSLFEMGDGEAGENRTITIQINNYTDRYVRIVGGRSTCNCTVINDLPIAIPPKHTRSVTILAKYQGTIGHFAHRYMLFTDDPNQRKLSARFSGYLIAKKNPVNKQVGSSHQFMANK